MNKQNNIFGAVAVSTIASIIIAFGVYVAHVVTSEQLAEQTDNADKAVAQAQAQTIQLTTTDGNKVTAQITHMDELFEHGVAYSYLNFLVDGKPSNHVGVRTIGHFTPEQIEQAIDDLKQSANNIK